MKDGSGDTQGAASSSSASAPSSSTPESVPKLPVCLLILGMAGSGKTTFTRRLYSYLMSQKKSVYSINLDPAVVNVPYPINIDIRDTVKYKQVMKQYQLGPNGAILTSLNLYATKFDQVLDLVSKRSAETDVVLIDTPGQIEVFNWSASGGLITEALAASFPTVAVYVLDSERCQKPITFMSNMMYACSILYKTSLPFLSVFNKIDVAPCDDQLRWMQDADEFLGAVQTEGSYLADLSRSMALVLEEYYRSLRVVSVSSLTGVGFSGLEGALSECVEDYKNEYQPYLEQRKKARKDAARSAAMDNFQKLQEDLKKGKQPVGRPGDLDMFGPGAISGPGPSMGGMQKGAGAAGRKPADPAPEEDEEDEWEDEDEDCESGDGEMDEEGLKKKQGKGKGDAGGRAASEEACRLMSGLQLREDEPN